MSATLEVQGLSVSYGAIPAVTDVDLKVPAGSVVALVGANGAGKTTTLSAVAGLLRPRRGSILLDGRRVDGLPSDRIARMGVCYVPESQKIFARLTVRENLALFADGAGVSDPAAHIDAVVQRFPLLGERLAQQAGTMSGGEQQMLAISRALVARPRLLMLDEISMGLAPLIVAQLFDHVEVLARSGMTILLVEQYVQDALRLADYVYVMAKGRVVAVGEPSDFESAELMSTYLGAVS